MKAKKLKEFLDKLSDDELKYDVQLVIGYDDFVGNDLYELCKYSKCEEIQTNKDEKLIVLSGESV